MNVLPLSNTNGEFVTVDDADFEWASRYTWFKSWNGYAYRQERKPNGKVRNIRMHRELIDAPSSRDIDHKNGDRLDNRRSNLRVCTRQENLRNKTVLHRDNSSGVNGVYRSKHGWIAQITLSGRNKHLGTFDNVSRAAEARRAAEVEHYKEYAPVEGAL